MTPGAGTDGYAIVYNHTSGKFELGTFDAAGAAAVAAHVALSDPHEQYALESALGTAAVLNAGTGANNIVQLDSSAKLPAVDGSQLTNLPGGAVAGSDTHVIFNDAGAYAGDAGLTYAKASDRLTVVGGLIAGDWSPPIDSTTAVSIWNAARSTRVVTVDTTNIRFGIGATPTGTLHAESSTMYFQVNAGVMSLGDSASNAYTLRFSDQFSKSTFSGISLTVVRGSGGRFDFSAAGGIASNPTIATGNIVAFLSSVTFSRGGSETLTALHLRDTINAAGITRGAHINPLIVYAPQYRGMDIENDAGHGVYQSNANIKNWFNAKTGFGNIPSPGALVDIDASTTASASLRIRTGVAPTTPNAGDIWYPTGGRLSLYRAATEIFATGVQATGGSATAGATWTSTEQDMLQKIYDAGRAFGILS